MFIAALSRVRLPRCRWPLALLLGAGCASADPIVPPSTPPSAEGMEWIQLFNGRDLGDWTQKFAGKDVGQPFNETFRVEDGLLKVRYDRYTEFTNEFGHLFYKQPYSYYLVAAEYRFVGTQARGGEKLSWAEIANRNNGIVVHSQSPESMGRDQDFPIAIEVQLWGGLGNGTSRTTGNVCTPGTHIEIDGRLVTDHCVNSRSRTYDGDQWVRAEVLVLGDSVIKNIVNGDTVLVYSKPRMGGGEANNTRPGVLQEGKPITGGYIAVQSETAPTDFRKIELVNLEGCMDTRATNYRSYFVKSDPAACRY